MSTIPRVNWRVREAAMEDLDAITATMALAFREDPVMSWTFPPARDRDATLERYFWLMASHLFIPRGRVLMTEDASGVAYWVPPGAWPVTPINLKAFAEATAQLFGARAAMLERGGHLMEEHHPTVPHYYLAGVGVHPMRWNRGVGTSVLSPMLAEADASGAGAYLEASTLRNVSLYERLGFRVRREVELPDGPTLFLMWRDPASRRS